MKDARLHEVVEPALASHGLELDDLEVIPAGRRSVLRITVDGDGPHGRGPLLDDISGATLSISAALDEIDVMKGAYTLEVSSRGTGRPLTESKHYRRNLTRLVKVTFTDGTTVIGRIVTVEGDQITLEVTPESVKGNRNPKPVAREVRLDDITKALVQIEMNRSIDDYDVDDIPDEDGPDEHDDTDEDDADGDDDTDEDDTDTDADSDENDEEDN